MTDETNNQISKESHILKIAEVLMNYLEKNDVENTWLNSEIRKNQNMIAQIKTFMDLRTFDKFENITRMTLLSDRISDSVKYISNSVNFSPSMSMRDKQTTKNFVFISTSFVKMIRQFTKNIKTAAMHQNLNIDREISNDSIIQTTDQIVDQTIIQTIHKEEKEEDVFDDFKEEDILYILKNIVNK